AEGTSHEAFVLGVTEHGLAVDPSGGAHHAVAGAGLVAHAPRLYAGPDAMNRSLVAEQLDPLDRREAFLLCGRGGAHAALRPRTALCPPNPNAFERPTAPLPFVPSSGFDSGT